MSRRRVTATILALGTGLLAATGAPAPASAHPGSTVYRIELHVVTPIEILVPADFGKPIDGVTITAATGFDLVDASAPGGWTVRRDGSSAVFSGGTIPAEDPGRLFEIRGAATARGALIFPIRIHSPDGTETDYRGGPGSTDAGAVVYAGVTPRVPGSGGLHLRTIGAVALTAAGIAVAGVLLLRRRRAHVG